MNDDMKVTLAARKESNRVKMYDALAKRDGAGDRLEAEAIRNADKPINRIQELRGLVEERYYRIELECHAEHDKTQDWPLYLDHSL